MAITLTQEFVDRYEEQIEARYKRDKEAVRGMRELLTRFESGEITEPVEPPPPGSTIQDMGLPPLDATTESQSLRSKIAEVCEQYPDEQWTMRRMLAYLQQVGFAMSDKKPEGSISAAMGKLASAKDGKLAVIRQGRGSIPSIYQWAAAVVHDDNPEETETRMEQDRESTALEVVGRSGAG